MFLIPLLMSMLLLHLCSMADAHGLMCEPRQRGAYISDKCGSDLPNPANPVTDYCAHCLNGGTVATVKAHLPPGGWTLYEPTKNFAASGDRAGLCGDAAGHNEHMLGGDFMPPEYGNVPMVKHWKKGSHVDFLAEIDTNHNGYFEFFLCDLDACKSDDISPRCFKGNHCTKLQRVPHPDCEQPSSNTHYECGPIDDVYPGRWYLPCRNTGHVGVHLVGGPSGTMRYALPKDVQCDHCVVQWYWATANSCAPRGLLKYMARHNNPFGTTCESDGGGRGTYRAGMAECGGEAVPEEFWSCADVQISGMGTAPGAPKRIPRLVATPPPGPNDELEAKTNPRKVLNEAEDELKKDIGQTANETAGERKRKERENARGQCVLLDEPCDGAVPCCDGQQVCVFISSAAGFRCTYWWSLWQEVEDREKAEKLAPQV